MHTEQPIPQSPIIKSPVEIENLNLRLEDILKKKKLRKKNSAIELATVKGIKENLELSAPIIEYAILHPDISLDKMRDNFFLNYNKILNSKIFATDPDALNVISAFKKFGDHTNKKSLSEPQDYPRITRTICKNSQKKQHSDLDLEKMKLEFLLN